MAGFSKDVSKNPDRETASEKQQKPQLDPKRIEMMKIRENLEAKFKQNSSYSCLNLVSDKTEKVLARPISSNLVTLDDFDDVPAHSGSASGHQSLNKLTQTAWPKKNGRKIISGDEDLPKRDDIAERRRKYELRRALAGAVLTDEGKEGCDHNQGINKAGKGKNLKKSEKIECEDKSDQEVKKQRTEKLSIQEHIYTRPIFVPEGERTIVARQPISREVRKHELRAPARGVKTKEVGNNLQRKNGKLEFADKLCREVKKQRTQKVEIFENVYTRPSYGPEDHASFVRQPVCREIMENRGLTRYRKKLTKNPRKKYKIKHEKAMMRRKGQVRDIRRPTGPYGGEPSGINIYVSRSIRLD